MSSIFLLYFHFGIRHRFLHSSLCPYLSFFRDRREMCTLPTHELLHLWQITQLLMINVLFPTNPQILLKCQSILFKSISVLFSLTIISEYYCFGTCLIFIYFFYLKLFTMILMIEFYEYYVPSPHPSWVYLLPSTSFLRDSPLHYTLPPKSWQVLLR